MATTITGSVLDFRCDPGFMHHRAQMRRIAGEQFEALELYRRASAAAPDNTRYKVDVADMLSSMGCARASYEQIAQLVNEGELSRAALANGRVDGDVLVLQACNLAALGQVRSASRLIDQARRFIRGPRSRQSFVEMRTQLMTHKLLGESKRVRLRTLRRMERYTAAGDAGHARALARRYGRHSDSPLAHAIMAWACALSGDQAGSMDNLVKSLAMRPQDPWILSVASRILAGGDARQARTALQGAFALSDDTECDATLLELAVALGMDGLVLDIAERMLTCAPWEPRLCAYRAAAMINTGVPARAALTQLRQSLCAYPGDATALRYVELAQQWTPGQPPLKYPEREMLEYWARTVAQAQARLIAGDVDPNDAQLVRTLEWGLNCGDAEISAASAALLVHVRGDLARAALWRFLASFDQPDGFRYAALALMAAADYPLPRLIFTRGRMHRLDAAAMCEMLASREPRRDLRAAVRRLGRYPLAISALKPMLTLSGARGGMRLMASALELAYRIGQGEAISLRAYAHKRSLSCRELTRAVDALLAAAHTSGRQDYEVH